MRFTRAWLAIALVSIAQVGVVSATTFDYQGFAYETGGFPLGSIGDTLTVAAVGTSLGPDLEFDPETEEATALLSGLVSQGPEDIGEGVFLYRYGTGRLDIYRDPSRDHDFGVSPPNATTPSTFTNGTLCLGGEVTDFVLYWDPETGSGAYEGNVRFDTGSCLASLSAASAEGFTFGGVFSADAVGEANIPEGYALQVDGFLEAQKKPVAEDCPFDCFGIEEAQFDFPRHGHRHNQRIGPKDGKFRIEGQFLLCHTDSTLDPEAVTVTVRIGDYTQEFGDGDLRPCRDDDDDDDAIWRPAPEEAAVGGAQSVYAGVFDTAPAADPRHPRDPCDDDHDDLAGDDDDDHHDRNGCWKYKNSRGQRTITKLVIERERSGEWTFEIHGRGIARGDLIPEGTLLEVELTIGTTSGVDEVTLTQKKKKLRFKTDDICEPECEDDDGGIVLPAPAGDRDDASGTVLLDAVPNPFNATTQIALRQSAPGAVQLRIFDIRGRLVRVLHDGALTTGTHRFTWHGDDEQGQAVSSGVYVYRLDAPGVSQSRKLVIAK